MPDGLLMVRRIRLYPNDLTSFPRLPRHARETLHLSEYQTVTPHHTVQEDRHKVGEAALRLSRFTDFEHLAGIFARCDDP